MWKLSKNHVASKKSALSVLHNKTKICRQQWDEKHVLFSLKKQAEVIICVTIIDLLNFFKKLNCLPKHEL